MNIIRKFLKRCREITDRKIITALVQVSVATMKNCVRSLGLELKGLGVIRNGLVIKPFGPKYLPTPIVGVGKIRLFSDCCVKIGEGHVEVTFVEIKISAEILSLTRIRLQLDKSCRIG